MKLLHASDLHIDSPMEGLERYEGAPVDAMRGATRRALENLVELALTEKVSLVLLAGDNFDGDWRDFNTGVYFAGQMDRLRAAGIPVVAIQGNHDAQSTTTKALHLDRHGVTLLATDRPQTVRFEDLGIAVHGQGFATPDMRDDLAAQYPKPLPGLLNIGLLHTALDGREGHAPYAPTTAGRLAAMGYGYWALGHVHERAIVRRDPWIVFSGNLQGRHMRETGAKGAMLFAVDDGRVENAEFRPLDVARWHVCPVDVGGVVRETEGLDRIESALREVMATSDGRLTAVRVVLSGSTALHGAWTSAPDALRNGIISLMQQFGTDVMWLEKVKLATSGIGAQKGGSNLEVLRRLEDQVAASQQLADVDLEPYLRELDALASRLPAAVRQGADGLDLRDTATVRTLLRSAGDLVLARLAEPGGQT
jgi:DNA repair exonuclease SbcCD nuclease subunit